MSLDNKRILVIGGRPVEVLDGIRHYANDARDEAHGARMAEALANMGAKVTLVTTQLHATKPTSVTVVNSGGAIITANDLLRSAVHEGREDFAAVVNLASISGIAPQTISSTKLKVKKEEGDIVNFNVVGNVDVERHLRFLFPHVRAIAGYDSGQQWFSQGDAHLSQAVRAVAEQCKQKPVSSARTITSQMTAGAKLTGRKIIVTSGPTREALNTTGDVLTNFSSGKQGYAVVEALANMGAQVVLITGPTCLNDPSHPNVRTVHANSAKSMRDAAMAELPADVFVGVAAVADFYMPQPATLRLQEGAPHTLKLAQNPDILQAMGLHATKRPQVVVGFAAETHDLLAYARDKLERKGADFICANNVGETMVQRGPDRNQITFVTAEGDEPLPEMTKEEVAEAIGEKIALLLKMRY